MQTAEELYALVLELRTKESKLVASASMWQKKLKEALAQRDHAISACTTEEQRQYILTGIRK